jgi:creatinine amidohydrolase
VTPRRLAYPQFIPYPARIIMLLTSSPWLHERSWTSVQEYLKHDDLILVPIGATEQHGRHTPLMVDTGWAIAVAEGAALATGTLVAPPQHVGWSPHHLAYCGALTFRPETLISVMVDIGESLIHHGFKKIVFVNGNRIANLPPMEIAAAKLRFSTGAYVSVIDAGLIARREVGEICQAGENGHGGDSETSFMLHWRPDLVDMSQAAPGKPHQTGGSFPTNPMPYQPPFDQNVISVRITAEEMLRGHESGISGDATVADADKGRRVLEAIVRNTARHIEEARRLKPEVRRPPIPI